MAEPLSDEELEGLRRIARTAVLIDPQIVSQVLGDALDTALGEIDRLRADHQEGWRMFDLAMAEWGRSCRQAAQRVLSLRERAETAERRARLLDVRPHGERAPEITSSVSER